MKADIAELQNELLHIVHIIVHNTQESIMYAKQNALISRLLLPYILYTGWRSAASLVPQREGERREVQMRVEIIVALY